MAAKYDQDAKSDNREEIKKKLTSLQARKWLSEHRAAIDEEVNRSATDYTILLDDARARKIAHRLNIKPIGTIGLLLRAKRRGLVESIKPQIDALLENGIYIRKELIDAVLKDAGE